MFVARNSSKKSTRKTFVPKRIVFGLRDSAVLALSFPREKNLVLVLLKKELRKKVISKNRLLLRMKDTNVQFVVSINMFQKLK